MRALPKGARPQAAWAQHHEGQLSTLPGVTQGAKREVLRVQGPRGVSLHRNGAIQGMPLARTRARDITAQAAVSPDKAIAVKPDSGSGALRAATLRRDRSVAVTGHSRGMRALSAAATPAEVAILAVGIRVAATPVEAIPEAVTIDKRL